MPNEVIPIVLFISVAAVLIFRPLTSRIGRVIERSQAEKTAVPEPQLQRVMQLLERLVDRMDRLEDRVDFTERMIERQRVQAQLSDGARHSESERPHYGGQERPDDPL